MAADVLSQVCYHQCCDLETIVSRLECTRVHFVQVSVSVSRPIKKVLTTTLAITVILCRAASDRVAARWCIIAANVVVRHSCRCVLIAKLADS